MAQIKPITARKIIKAKNFFILQTAQREKTIKVNIASHFTQKKPNSAHLLSMLILLPRYYPLRLFE